MTKDEQAAYMVELEGTRESHIRSCKRSIKCMAEVFNLDRGDMLAIVNDVLPETQREGESYASRNI